MSLDGDLIKQSYVNNDTTSVQVTSASTSSTQVASSSVNTVFETKKTEEIAKKLGLTTEEYLKLTSDPNFLSLTPEEQIKYIKAYKEMQQTQVPVTETTQVISTGENSEVSQSVISQNVKEAKVQEKIPPVQETVSTTEELELKLNESGFFDSKTYSELEPDKQREIYIREYTKNKFLFGDSTNKPTIDDWNNLTEQEKNRLMKQANRELIKEKYILSKAQSDEDGLDVTQESAYWQEKMKKLQAANSNYISLKEFSVLPKHQQVDYMWTYLHEKNSMSPSSLSDVERQTIDFFDMSLTSVKEYLAKNGSTDGDICFDDIGRLVQEGDVKLGVAMLDYLKEKSKTGELTKMEESILKNLEKVSPKYLEEFGIRFGEISAILEEIQNGDSKFSARYNRASSQVEKMSIVSKYVSETYKDSPEKILEMMHDANECGDIALVMTLHSLAKNNPEFAKLLANDKNIDTININASNMDVLGDSSVTAMKSIAALEDINPQTAENFGVAAINSSTDEQITEISAISSGMKSELVQQRTVDRGYEVKKPDIQMSVMQNVKKNSSEKIKDYAAVNANKALVELQNKVLHLFTDDSATATQAAIDAGTITRFAKENQVEGFKTLQFNAEALLPQDTAIQSLNKLADQIVDCDVSNQLDMHKSITGSKYAEVQKHAASNIYKYDKSVQADALKVTYDSGNAEAIDAANLQLDKYDKEALKSVSKEISMQLQAMEQRSTKTLAQKTGEYLVFMDAASDPTESEKWSVDDKNLKVAEYMQAFMKANPATKFKMISKLQGVWQAEVITHIATYCPEMLSSLISAMGSDLFQLQITPEVKNKIMQEMLRIPDMQADALKYFKDNPNGFSDDIKQTCAELMVARKDQALDNPVIKESFNSELYMSSPDSFASGGKISNREYYSNFRGNTTLWKRDKYGNFVC